MAHGRTQHETKHAHRIVLPKGGKLQATRLYTRRQVWILGHFLYSEQGYRTGSRNNNLRKWRALLTSWETLNTSERAAAHQWEYRVRPDYFPPPRVCHLCGRCALQRAEQRVKVVACQRAVCDSLQQQSQRSWPQGLDVVGQGHHLCVTCTPQMRAGSVEEGEEHRQRAEGVPLGAQVVRQPL